MASPWEDFFFQLEASTGASSEAAQAAYGRYIEGANAIVKSIDVPVGLTPKDQVWKLNKTTLYRYHPRVPAEQRRPIPLLLVYALINKPFIFDLLPGRSFIEFMLEDGFDVFLLDWGSPGPEDKNITFDGYVTDYLRRAVRKVLRISDAQELSLLGYCLGATLTTIYAGLYPEAPVRNIILLTAPIDFSEQPEGSMAVWLDEDRLDVDKLVDTLGNVPGELIRQWAKLLKPAENFVGVYVNLWKMLDDKTAVWSWQAINRWVEDIVPVAGEAFRQFVKEYVRENRLVKGEHTIDGRPVDLANIRASLLNIVAEHDHLVAQSQAEGIMDLISSEDKELIVIPSTHVGIMISRRAKYKLWPEVAAWLGERSD
jgi:polyhydroxyalkanoate synthase